MAQKENPDVERAHAEYVARRNAALKQMFAQRDRDIADGKVELWDDERLFVELAKRRGAYGQD